MNDSTRVSYHRQRRQRGLAKVHSHRNYMKHRSQNKLRARKRYRRMKNNPAFKRRQRMYRMNPRRFKRLAADMVLVNLPFWSAALGDGIVVGADDDEVFYVLAPEYEDVEVIDYQDFLDTAVFLDDVDIDKFFDLLDGAMGTSLEVSAVSDALVNAMEARETGSESP